MKTRVIVLSCLAVGMVLADESTQTAGPVVDGAPSQASGPAKLEIRPEDVISSKVTDIGDRKITVREVAPIELPSVPDPEPQVAMRVGGVTEPKGRSASSPERVIQMMSISVYRSEAYPGKVRTLFRWWSQDRSREFEAWSNVDGGWLSGFGEFDSGGKHYVLLFGVGEQDVDKQADSMARLGKQFSRPEIPDLPQTGPAFVVTKGNPGQEESAPIQAIHDLIRNEGERLRLAYEDRKQARQAQEELEKTAPPKTKDIVLNFWRIQKQPATNDDGNGGGQ